MLSHFSHTWLVLCDPMDCSQPVSSVPGILQATILEWVAMPSSRRSFWPGDWTQGKGWFFTTSITSEKAMAPHSSTLAWKIPWTEEPGWLQSMGSLESDTTERLPFHISLFTFMHWRRKWQPTPVFLPGESQGWGNLVGCRLWSRTESDTTEET